MAEPDIALGIDVGGTFTDVLALDRDAGKLVSAFKVLSTPGNLAAGAMIGSTDIASAPAARPVPFSMVRQSVLTP